MSTQALGAQAMSNPRDVATITGGAVADLLTAAAELLRARGLHPGPRTRESTRYRHPDAGFVSVEHAVRVAGRSGTAETVWAAWRELRLEDARRWRAELRKPLMQRQDLGPPLDTGEAVAWCLAVAGRVRHAGMLPPLDPDLDRWP